MSRVVVYTAIIGEYEQPLEQPTAESSDARFVCFTDSPTLQSDSWDIVVVKPAILGDPIRSARRLKALGHPELEGYDYTIWVDSSILLTQDPIALTEYVKRDAPLATLNHWFRDDVLDEFLAVMQGGHDSLVRVQEQLSVYEMLAPEILGQRPYATGVIIRRSDDPRLRNAMGIWFDHILRFSRRDQLSFNFAVSTAQLPVNRIAEALPNSWASWPHSIGRMPHLHGRDSILEDARSGVLRKLLAQQADMAHREVGLRRTTEILRAEISATLRITSELGLAGEHTEKRLRRRIARLERKLSKARLKKSSSGLAQRAGRKFRRSLRGH
jgi:hypothetical protein